MTDFNIVAMAVCGGTNHFTIKGSRGNSYLVGPFGNERCDPQCDCDGFKFRGKCRHVKEAEKLWCSYHELIDGPPIDGRCPKCGAEVSYVNVAV